MIEEEIDRGSKHVPCIIFLRKPCLHELGKVVHDEADLVVGDEAGRRHQASQPRQGRGARRGRSEADRENAQYLILVRRESDFIVVL